MTNKDAQTANKKDWIDSNVGHFAHGFINNLTLTGFDHTVILAKTILDKDKEQNFGEKFNEHRQDILEYAADNTGAEITGALTAFLVPPVLQTVAGSVGSKMFQSNFVKAFNGQKGNFASQARLGLHLIGYAGSNLTFAWMTGMYTTQAAHYIIGAVEELKTPAPTPHVREGSLTRAI